MLKRDYCIPKNRVAFSNALVDNKVFISKIKVIQIKSVRKYISSKMHLVIMELV